MSKIRERVIAELRGAGFGEGQINYVLGMREIVIVNRDASLPPCPYGARTNIDVYLRAVKDFKEDGWVKEVKP